MPRSRRRGLAFSDTAKIAIAITVIVVAVVIIVIRARGPREYEVSHNYLPAGSSPKVQAMKAKREGGAGQDLSGLKSGAATQGSSAGSGSAGLPPPPPDINNGGN